jgi:hypothetical protein
VVEALVSQGPPGAGVAAHAPRSVLLQPPRHSQDSHHPFHAARRCEQHGLFPLG